MKFEEIKIENFKIKNNNDIFLIAGPCVIENKNHSIKHAKIIKEICDE